MREPIKSYESWDIFDTGDGCCPELDVRKLEADYTELEDENQSLNRRYEVLSDYTISQQLIRDRLYAAIERLKTDREELEKKYKNDPATIQLLECTDRCIELEEQRDELKALNKQLLETINGL